MARQSTAKNTKERNTQTRCRGTDICRDMGMEYPNRGESLILSLLVERSGLGTALLVGSSGHDGQDESRAVGRGCGMRLN